MKGFLCYVTYTTVETIILLRELCSADNSYRISKSVAGWPLKVICRLQAKELLVISIIIPLDAVIS